MDPDEALEQIRSLVRTLTEPRMDVPAEQVAEQGEELANLFEGLDEWLTKGGYPPKVWRQEPGKMARLPPSDVIFALSTRHSDGKTQRVLTIDPKETPDAP